MTIIELKQADIYQNDTPILKDINFSIAMGEFAYLIGRVGSGKSSLLKTLYAELPLKKGEGKVMGFDLHTLERKEIPFLRRKIGIVFQDFKFLTDRDVYQNLYFVLKATQWKLEMEIEKRINEVLQLVGLPEKKHSMPHQLSGGEQQRIAIARAMLNNPDVILADEPTGNLDPTSSDAVMELLWDLPRRGKSVIMATHDYGLIKTYYSKIYKCENSQLKKVVIKSKEEQK